MNYLTFQLDDRLKQIIDHAAAHDPGEYFGSTIERSLFVVKDQGAYLMSAGQPGLLDPDGKTATSQLVQYAKGHNPNTPQYSWDYTRSICGGDDFGEPIGVDFFINAVKDGATVIKIGLGEDSFDLIAE